MPRASCTRRPGGAREPSTPERHRNNHAAEVPELVLGVRREEALDLARRVPREPRRDIDEHHGRREADPVLLEALVRPPRRHRAARASCVRTVVRGERASRWRTRRPAGAPACDFWAC